jgi:LytTr DNA-binding domain
MSKKQINSIVQVLGIITFLILSIFFAPGPEVSWQNIFNSFEKKNNDFPPHPPPNGERPPLSPQNQKPLVARLTMKNLLEKLPNKKFLRVHRSFIVPINRIEKLNNRLIVNGNEEIPIGVSYEEEVKKVSGKLTCYQK